MTIHTPQKKSLSLGLKGVYTFTKAVIKTPLQWKLHEKIVVFQRDGLDIMPLVRELNRICKIEQFQIENIIPTVGRTMIANNLTASSPTNTPLINYTALGTGTGTPANGDTTLGTETFRKTTASRTNSNNVAYVTAFYTASEVTGTFKEHGLFSNGTASANTGVLFSRVLLNPTSGITKSGTETLTIDYVVTIT